MWNVTVRSYGSTLVVCYDAAWLEWCHGNRGTAYVDEPKNFRPDWPLLLHKHVFNQIFEGIKYITGIECIPFVIVLCPFFLSGARVSNIFCFFAVFTVNENQEVTRGGTKILRGHHPCSLIVYASSLLTRYPVFVTAISKAYFLI